MKPIKPDSRFAICINNFGYPASLELHKIYRVVPDANAAKDGDVRVIDESGEDYLYPANYFILIGLPRETVRVLNKSFTRKPHMVAA
ncbi:MAG: hypothetical protein HZC40_05540 [Chloroflexi bacterium]|nr:hypothetical protein [Chloroflexota bacterium]